MPRLTNRPPRLCHDKRRNKARVCIDGKVVVLGDWGTEEAKAAYGRLIQKWRRDRGSDSVPLNDRYLVVELCADYVEFVAEYYGEGHNRATSITPVIQRFGLHFGDLWVDQFRPRYLERARQVWIDRGCSRKYINRTIRDIVRCFKWGVTKDMVPSDVWKSLEAVPPLDIGRYGVPEAPDVEPVPLDVVDETLPGLPDFVADMVRIQLLSGCRPNEIMRLTPGEIDREGDVWKYRPTKHKNTWRGKKRTVYFGPQAQAILAKYLLRPEGRPCFTTKHDKAFARGGYRQVIRRTVERINEQRAKEAEEAGVEFAAVPHWTPNQLRHTKATELRKMKNLEAARAILGHGSTAVTTIYAELNEEPAIEVAREFG